MLASANFNSTLLDFQEMTPAKRRLRKARDEIDWQNRQAELPWRGDYHDRADIPLVAAA
jgi:hypothetical protein